MVPWYHAITVPWCVPMVHVYRVPPGAIGHVSLPFSLCSLRSLSPCLCRSLYAISLSLSASLSPLSVCVSVCVSLSVSAQSLSLSLSRALFSSFPSLFLFTPSPSLSGSLGGSKAIRVATSRTFLRLHAGYPNTVCAIYGRCNESGRLKPVHACGVRITASWLLCSL